jgi:hypothetical protein
MDKSQIVSDFLFPADKKTSCAVGPGMTAFDHPTMCAAAGMPPHSNLAFARHVQDILQLSGQCFRRLRHIAFVQAEMLFATAAGFRSRHGHRTQRSLQERNVMGVGGGHGHADGHAAGVSYNRPFDAQLTTICGIFAGFFPRPAAIWSSSRPGLANAKRFPAVHHTFADIFSRNDRRHDYGSIPESTDAPCLTRQTAAAKPSIDSRYARDKGFHRRLAEDWPVDGRLLDYGDTWAEAAPIAATFFPAFAQNDYTNHKTFSPPCVEQVIFLSCPTPEVTFGSVLG